MPEYCSCSAELPPDARFCHRCGKPQREADLAREAAERIVVAPVETPVEAPVEIVAAGPNFHNPIAVRAALLAASLGTLLFLLIRFGFVIWLVGAGFLGTWLFARRSRQTLTVRAGARMGWLTGVLSFVLLTVLFSVSAALSEGQLAQMYREQLQQMPAGDPKMAEAIQMLETPGGMAMVFVTSFAFLFMMVTAFCTAGGALGAKVLDKR
ncbi:MAG: hypothetical protein ACKV22_28385 [Bryobacteraceae bacterium]